MCVTIFSTTFVRNISHSKKNWPRYNQICKLVFKINTLYSCLILMALGFLDSFSKNTQMPNRMKIRPVGVESMRTDGHDEANSRFSQFCERA
jgi:hypothetical protein